MMNIRFRHILYATMMISPFLILSCSDELSAEGNKNPSSIYFRVSTSQLDDQSSMTRSSIGEVNNSLPVAFQGSTGHTGNVYLHESCYGQIDEGLRTSRQGTRGSIITNENLSTFRAWGYYSDHINEESTDSIFKRLDITKNTTTTTLWSSAYAWPNNHEFYRFYGITPYSATGVVINDRNTAFYWAPEITYTPSTNVDEQVDLLEATTITNKEEMYSRQGEVPLQFKHITTAVRFSVDELPAGDTIKSITISDVLNQGTYFLLNNTGFDHTGWQYYNATKTSYTINFGTGYIVDNDSKNNYITDKVMFVVPQYLPDSARISAVVRHAGVDHTIYADLGGKKWPMGATVIYKLSSSAINYAYELSVDPIENFSHQAGSKTYRVTSFLKDNGGNTTTAKGWTITGYKVDDAANFSNTCPSWLTLSVTSSDGTLVNVSGSASISEAGYSTSGNHITNLQVQKGGYDATHAEDLSFYDADGNRQVSRNTANCYVVHGYGWYKFPMVYGNAIANYRTNASSYSSATSSSETYLNCFKNARGENISSPWIRGDLGIGNNSRLASVIWSDAEGLIDTEVVTSNDYVIFHIDRDKIKPGNAVIALWDGDGKTNDANIVWSWHIWVTDESLGYSDCIPVTNQNNYTSHMMPVNLGWVDSESSTRTYLGRKCVVELTQETSGKKATFVINQVGERIRAGYNTYYQWGRKDAMPPNKTFYSVAYPNQTKARHPARTYSYSASSTGSIAEGILNPEKLIRYSSTANWLNGNIINLWDMGNTQTILTGDVVVPSDARITKTIYDPCPVGYHVPSSGALTGFTSIGANSSGFSSSEEYWNILGTISNWNAGWSFFSAPLTANSNPKMSEDAITIYFPATGFRGDNWSDFCPIGSTASNTGDVWNDGDFGCYWNAGFMRTDNTHARAGAFFFHYDRSETDANGRSGKNMNPLVNSNNESAPWHARSIRPAHD